MTPRVTAKLVAAVVARGEDLPTPAARDVLLSLLGLALRRERVPTMAEMAKRWAIGEERLSTALSLLSDYRLLAVATDPQDARRRVPQLNLALIQEWSVGDYVLVRAGNGRPVDWGDTPENAGHLDGDTPEKTGFPRAGAASSSSSSSFALSAASLSEAARVAAEVAAAREFEEYHKRAIQSFRDWGVQMPRGCQRELWQFMRRGIQFEDAEEVARAMAGAGSRAWNYAVKCFEERLRDGADGRVKELLRGWEYAETKGEDR